MPESLSDIAQGAGRFVGFTLDGTFNTDDGTAFCPVEVTSQQVVLLKLNGKVLVSMTV